MLNLSDLGPRSLTFAIHIGLCPHLVNCIYQLWRHRLHYVTHKSTVARTVMCREDSSGRFLVLLDDRSKCRTNSQRKSQLRIFYTIFTLNDIYKQYNKFTQTLIHKNQFTSPYRGQKPASKCIRLVYEILVICRALQALYTPQQCELMKKKITLNCSCRIFIVCRSPVSPIFWARILLS